MLIYKYIKNCVRFLILRKNCTQRFAASRQWLGLITEHHKHTNKIEIISVFSVKLPNPSHCEKQLLLAGFVFPFSTSHFSTFYIPFWALLSIARMLHFVARTLHSCTRTLYSCPRTLYSCARTLYSSARTLYSSARTLHSSARTLHSSARTLHSSARTLHSSARTL